MIEQIIILVARAKHSAAHLLIHAADPPSFSSSIDQAEPEQPPWGTQTTNSAHESLKQQGDHTRYQQEWWQWISGNLAYNEI